MYMLTSLSLSVFLFCPLSEQNEDLQTTQTHASCEANTEQGENGAKQRKHDIYKSAMTTKLR